MSVGDAVRLSQWGTAVGRDAMAVVVEYHGGLGGMDGENTIVIVVELTGAHVGLVLGST